MSPIASCVVAPSGRPLRAARRGLLGDLRDALRALGDLPRRREQLADRRGDLAHGRRLLCARSPAGWPPPAARPTSSGCWTADPSWRRERARDDERRASRDSRHEQRPTRMVERAPSPRRSTSSARFAEQVALLVSISPRIAANLVHGLLAFAVATIFCVGSKPPLRRRSMVRFSSASFASTSGSSSSSRFCWLGLSAVSARSSSSVVGQRADGAA